MSTSITNSTKEVGDNIIDTTSIPFMRSKEVEFKALGMKPHTQVWPFFDGRNVSAFCRPNGGNFGQALVTDANGSITGKFKIPNTSSMRFRVGTRMFKLMDTTTGNESESNSFAEGSYTASGQLVTRQKTLLTTRTITNTKTETKTITRWKDPLAQSFLIEAEGGNFITDVELWFSSKDSNIPVTVEIREMENGYPSQRKVPYGTKTLTPSAVAISADGKSNSTKFKFDTPVYLQQGVEYCFVIMANSTKYNVWISRMGETVVGTKFSVSKQPHVGVMFKSQNNSTWTAAQEDDIKFTIWRAKFATGVESNVKIVNDVTIPVRLDNNSIYVTNGSNIGIVRCYNHGLFVGSSVDISGAIAGAGITAANINKKHTVLNVIDLDNFTIDLTSTANTDGRIGGANMEVDKNYLYDTIMPIIPNFSLSNTELKFDVDTTTGMNVGGAETPYISMPKATDVEIGEYLYYGQPQAVLNPSEELDNNSNQRSLTFTARLKTDRDNVSPVVDLEGATATLITNRISQVADPADEVVVNGGTAMARYMTKAVNLALEATSLKLLLDIDRPEDTDVMVYYRIAQSESELRSTEWTHIEPLEWAQRSSSGEFFEHEFEADDVGSFTSFQVKIVLSSISTSIVPRVGRLRGIALGT